MTRLPQVPLDSSDPAVARVFARFAEEGREPIALYRVLAGAPWLLEAYNGLADAMRQSASLPRALRELVILRGAQLLRSDYEWAHHRKMAAAAGVPEVKIEALARWRESRHFDERERAALACVDAVDSVELTDLEFAMMRRHFDQREMIELVSLCAFYAMVGRLIQGLGVELEAAYADYLGDGPDIPAPQS